MIVQIPLGVIRIRNHVVVHSWPIFIHPNQLSWITVWKRPYQHRVNHAENRGICPDTECQSHDSDGGEAWILPQHARTKIQVLQKYFDHRQPSTLPNHFFRLFDAAQFHESLPPRSEERRVGKECRCGGSACKQYEKERVEHGLRSDR